MKTFTLKRLLGIIAIIMPFWFFAIPTNAADKCSGKTVNVEINFNSNATGQIFIKGALYEASGIYIRDKPFTYKVCMIDPQFSRMIVVLTLPENKGTKYIWGTDGIKISGCKITDNSQAVYSFKGTIAADSKGYYILQNGSKSYTDMKCTTK